MRSIRLFGEKVMPALRDYEPFLTLPSRSFGNASCERGLCVFGLCGLIVLFASPATHALAADDVWRCSESPATSSCYATPMRPAARPNPTR